MKFPQKLVLPVLCLGASVLPSREVQDRIIAACKRMSTLEDLQEAISMAKAENQDQPIDFCFKTDKSAGLFPLSIVSNCLKAKLLVDSGATFECPNSQEPGDYPLIDAIKKSSIKRFQCYLDLGAGLCPGGHNVIYHLCSPSTENYINHHKMLHLALGHPEAASLLSLSKPGGTTPLGRLVKEDPEDRSLPNIESRISLLIDACATCYVPLYEGSEKTIFECLVESYQGSPYLCPPVFDSLFRRQFPPEDFPVIEIINRASSEDCKETILDSFAAAVRLQDNYKTQGRKLLAFGSHLYEHELQDVLEHVLGHLARLIIMDGE